MGGSRNRQTYESRRRETAVFGCCWKLVKVVTVGGGRRHHRARSISNNRDSSLLLYWDRCLGSRHMSCFNQLQRRIYLSSVAFSSNVSICRSLFAINRLKSKSGWDFEIIRHRGHQWKVVLYYGIASRNSAIGQKIDCIGVSLICLIYGTI